MCTYYRMRLLKRSPRFLTHSTFPAPVKDMIQLHIAALSIQSFAEFVHPRRTVNPRKRWLLVHSDF